MMEYETFSIYSESDNTKVKLLDIDDLICKELNLDCSGTDYGHFHFSEPQNTIKKGCRTAISWAALLHVIAYYSDIQYGRCTSYDIESAIAWVRHFAITLPPSVIDFTYKLMQVLTQNGLYVYVNLLHDIGRKNEFFCGYDGTTLYRNETGMYKCDTRSFLNVYYPAISNLMEKSQIRQEYSNLGLKSYYHPSVEMLIIPSGIKYIDSSFYYKGYVNKYVLLPDTLEVLDGFKEAFVRELTIPKSVRSMNFNAFKDGYIQSLRLEEIGKCDFDSKAFSGCKIEYLSIPETEMRKAIDLPFFHSVKHFNFH